MACCQRKSWCANDANFCESLRVAFSLNAIEASWLPESTVAMNASK